MQLYYTSSGALILFLTCGVVWTRIIKREAEYRPTLTNDASIQQISSYPNPQHGFTAYDLPPNHKFVPSQQFEYASIYEQQASPTLQDSQSQSNLSYNMNSQWTADSNYQNQVPSYQPNIEDTQRESHQEFSIPSQPIYASKYENQEIAEGYIAQQSLHGNLNQNNGQQYGQFLPSHFYEAIDLTLPQNTHNNLQYNEGNLQPQYANQQPLDLLSNYGTQQKYNDHSAAVNLIPNITYIKTIDLTKSVIEPTPVATFPTVQNTYTSNADNRPYSFSSTGMDYPTHSQSGFMQNIKVDLRSSMSSPNTDQPYNFNNFNNRSTSWIDGPPNTPLLTNEITEHYDFKESSYPSRPKPKKCHRYADGVYMGIRRCKSSGKYKRRSPYYRVPKNDPYETPFIKHGKEQEYSVSPSKEGSSSIHDLGTFSLVTDSAESSVGDTPNTRRPIKFILRKTVRLPSFCKKLPSVLKDLMCS